MYSALISKSSTVALIPRLSSTGLRVRPTSVSSTKVLHVPRADLDHVGILLDQLARTAGPSLRSPPAVPNLSPVSRRIFSPSSPMP